MTKTALVTGASSGIGLATARLLLQNNYQVVGISRRCPVADLEHDQFTGVSLDLSRLDSIDAPVRAQLKQYEFDCFIHAAGYGRFGSIEQFSVSQIDQAIRVNLTSALVLSRLVIPEFRRRNQGLATGRADGNNRPYIGNPSCFYEKGAAGNR